MIITYRKATMNDIDLLVKLRLAFLEEDSGDAFEPVRGAVTMQLKEYFPAHIERDCFCYFAEEYGVVLATAMLSIYERPAGTLFPTGRIGRLSSVYTIPEQRRKGVASGLIKYVLSEADTMNLSYIELTDAEDAKPMYEKFGFVVRQSNYTEMVRR